MCCVLFFIKNNFVVKGVRTVAVAGGVVASMVCGSHVGASVFAACGVVEFGSFLGVVGGGVVVVDRRLAVVCFLQFLTGKIDDRGAGRNRGRKKEEG